MDPTCSFTDPLFEKSPYSNEAFLKLSDALPDLLVHVHRADSLELVFVSRNLPDLLGYAVAELTGDASGLGSLLAEPVSFSPFQPDEENRVYTLKLRHKNGQTRAFKTQVSVFERDLAACPVLLLGVSRDISGEIELAEALQQSQRLHEENRMALRTNEALLNESEQLLHYGGWLWNVPENRHSWTEGMWELLDYPPEERIESVSADKYLEHLHPDDRPAQETGARQIAETGRGDQSDTDYRLVTHSGRVIWVISRFRVLEWTAEGKPALIVGSTADITHLKNAQQEMEVKVTELNRSNQDLEQFAYIASHDLQEPLRKISSFGNRLFQKYHSVLDEDGRMYLERMSNAARRMQHLIDDLLEFSRIGRKQDSFQPTNLGFVARRLLSDLEVRRQEKEALIEIEELPVIEAIPSQIHQLFLNLFNNALKFSRPGIPSRVSVSSHPLNPVEKRNRGLASWKNYVKICVTDNGIGFEQEHAEKIFAIFQRLHGRSEYEGSGIGLAICRKIVENHKGIISAEGRPGEGAAFTIILPEKQGEG